MKTTKENIEENIATETVLITPDMAKEMLIKSNGNRPINRNRVAKYATDMAKGAWVVSGEGIDFDVYGQLINGHHRLNAIIRYGSPIAMRVTKGLPEDAYVVYDSGLLRSYGDVFAIEGIKNASIAAATVRRFLELERGAKTTEGSTASGLGITRKDCVVKYQEDPDFWNDIVTMSQKCNNQYRIITPSIMGAFAACLILKQNKKKALVYKFFMKCSKLKMHPMPVPRENSMIN